MRPIATQLGLSIGLSLQGAV